MTTTATHLPGKLGNPELTLVTDPRLDPAMLLAVDGMDEALGQPPAVGPDSSYEEVVAYAAAMEAEFDVIYEETFGALPPVEGESAGERRWSRASTATTSRSSSTSRRTATAPCRASSTPTAAAW